MSSVFIRILNMSLTASAICVIILLVRLCLRRAPKKYSYALWIVVLFRLLCPLSLESPVSAVPTASPIPENIEYAHTMSVQPSIPVIDSAVRRTIRNNMQDRSSSMNRSQLEFYLLSHAWLVGMIILLFKALFSYIKLRHKLCTATLLRENIFESDQIATPFILGILRPRIYLPPGLDGSTLSCVLLHEQAHIRRFDHVVKLLAFIALTIHWFNPILWICYYLACRDMELSCDESVLRNMQEDGRREYSHALLSLAMPRRALLSPLAFGESDIKTRIKNILRFKPPHRLFATLALALCTLTLVVCALNPRSLPTDLPITAGEAQLPCLESTGELPSWWPLHLRKLPYVPLGETVEVRLPDVEQVQHITLLDSVTDETGKLIFEPTERLFDLTDAKLSFTLQSNPLTALRSTLPAKDGVSRTFQLSLKMNDNSIRTFHFSLRTDSSTLIGPIEALPSTASPDNGIGMTIPELYYFDGKTAVFHGLRSLFVYDLEEEQMIRAIDVGEIGCGFTQGDHYCEVTVSPDGKIVSMHPISSDTLYLYDIEENTLHTSGADVGFTFGTAPSLSSLEEVFGANTFSGSTSYLCARTETQAAYLRINVDNWLVSGIQLCVYDFEKHQTAIYSLFSDAETELVTGTLFEHAFVPMLGLSMSVGDGQKDLSYQALQTCFKGCDHTHEYPREKSYQQHPRGFSPKGVTYIPYQEKIQGVFPSKTDSAPVSIRIHDSVLDVEGTSVLGTFEAFDVPIQEDTSFSFKPLPAGAMGKGGLSNGTAIHGISIEATMQNGDVFEYRFLISADYK